MADIKVRNIVKGTVKTIDRSFILASRIKDSFVRINNFTENTEYNEDSITTYPKQPLPTYNIHTPKRHTLNLSRSIKQIFKPAKDKNTIKSTVKLTGKTFNTTKRTVQNAQAVAKTTTQSIKFTLQTIITTSKAAIKVMITAVKAIIEGMKEFIAALAAGGWVSVLIIALICVIGLIACSCYGIFFSPTPQQNTSSLREVVQELNTDYLDYITQIQNANPHDKVEYSGNRAEWKEIFSLYAVKTSLQITEVDSMISNIRKDVIKDIFWQMNSVTSTTEYRDDGKTYLCINTTHKSLEQMCQILGFYQEQEAMVNELLSSYYSDMWNEVLFDKNDIVAVALSQVGNIGGEPYWSWYGFEGRVDWCACFVSWCANECGYIDAGIMPKFSGCMSGEKWFKDRGLWRDNIYTPAPGDLIFFDWDDKNGQDGKCDHVGIVSYVDTDIIYIIEGNYQDTCTQNSYAIAYKDIYGFGIILN